MPNIRYIVKRIFRMDYKAMLNIVAKVSKESGKSKMNVFFDIIWCGIRYGAGYVDYDTIHFWDLNGKQRKTILTRGINDKYVKKLNNKEYWHYLNNKSEFNEKFSKFIQRSWISPVKGNKEKILDWLFNKDYIIAKPEAGSCGKGILKINVKDYELDLEKLYEYLLENEIGLLEEVIVQAEEMNAIYPYAVNTIRVVTVLKENNEAKILAAAMRIGNEGRHVDNFNSDGLVIMVDIEKGKTKQIAVNKKGVGYISHPMTNTKIADIYIPRWNEIVDTVLEAAKIIPELRYVGWDVAITPEGVTLIEGNQFPGHDIYQMSQFMTDKKGILPRFKEIIGV